MAKTIIGAPTTEVLAPRRPARSRSLWGDAARTFRRSPIGMAALVVAGVIFFVAIFAPLIAPYGYAAQDWQHIGQPPSLQHLMGTDALGRDLFSRVLMGVRTAVFVALLVTGSTAVIGTLVGALGALSGGWIDTAVVWLIDTLLAFPSLWLAAFISVIARPKIDQLGTAIYHATSWSFMRESIVLDYLVVFGSLSLVWWAGLGRLVRGQVLSLREKEFVEAQHAIGASRWWITTRHLVPNVLGLVIVHMSTGFGGAMLAEASLSFLGIGIRPPGASLGQMIFDGMATWLSQPYLVAMPGLTLAFIVLTFVFLGDALNDALNPRLRQR